MTVSEDPIRPRVGCGAAILKDGRLLLARRIRPPEAGCWGLPGGKVDPGETTLQTIVREIDEELGLTIRPARLLCVTDLIGEDHHWVSPVYLVEDFDGEPAIRETHALSDWGWFDLDDLPSPLTQATRDAVRAL